jgi:hypothetical protein
MDVGAHVPHNMGSCFLAWLGAERWFEQPARPLADMRQP